MSLHYDWAMAFDLNSDTPQQVIDTLSYMTRRTNHEFNSPPAHRFFEDDTWRTMLQISPGETYCPGEVGSAFRLAYRYTQLEVDVYRWTLSFRCYMLDDGFYETWWVFCDWVAPYSETVGCVGYYREQDDWQPTLIYFREGKIYICEVVQTPVALHEGKPW